MSQKKLNWPGRVSNNNLRLFKYGEATEQLVKIFGNDVNINVLFTQDKPDRSELQNNWYWGVAIPDIIKGVKEIEYVIFDKYTVHEFNLEHVLKIQGDIKWMLGLPIKEVTGKRTSAMNVEEFNNMKDALQQWYAEKNIIIRDPDQKQFT